MKEALRKDWPYLLLTLALVGLSVLSVDSFRYGFHTAFDQAYMFLKLQEAYDGSYITGKSQWNLLAIHLFPYLDLTSKANSYLAAAILNWLTIVIATCTAMWLYDKRRGLMYFALIFLVYFYNASRGMGLSYVTMQGSLLCWALCSFVLSCNSKNQRAQYVLAYVTGVLLGCSWFVILPGAALVSGGVLLVIVLTYWPEPIRMMRYVGYGLLGMFSTAAVVHLFVCPLNEIAQAMYETAQFFTKESNYDGGSMLRMYASFIRHLVLMMASFAGIYYLSTLFKNKTVGQIIYAFLCLAYVYYTPKDRIDPYMTISSLVFIPYLFTRVKDPDYRLTETRTYYRVFLFLFPILAVAGTNTGVLGRLYLFVLPWLFLYFDTIKDDSRYKVLLWPILLLFLIPSAGLGNVSPLSTIQTNRAVKAANTYHFEKGNTNFAKVGINKTQCDYFERIDTLLKEYNYVPHQSTMFALAYDYSNIYVFDAVNVSHFLMAQYFPYMDVSQTPAPDFMFLCRFDSASIGDALRAAPWDWPEKYDEYMVGCPEDTAVPTWYNVPDISTRYLYCRRALRKASDE